MSNCGFKKISVKDLKDIKVFLIARKYWEKVGSNRRLRNTIRSLRLRLHFRIRDTLSPRRKTKLTENAFFFPPFFLPRDLHTIRGTKGPPQLSRTEKSLLPVLRHGEYLTFNRFYVVVSKLKKPRERFTSLPRRESYFKSYVISRKNAKAQSCLINEVSRSSLARGSVRI